MTASALRLSRARLHPVAWLSLALLGLLGLALVALLWPHWRNHPDLSHGFFMPLVFFVLLLLARFFLVRRAFLSPFDLLPRLFKQIDRAMKWANRFVGGVVLYRDGGSVPVDDPVFWRETQRRVLGKPHYLFRLLCALEVPTVLLCLVVVLGEFLLDLPENLDRQVFGFAGHHPHLCDCQTLTCSRCDQSKA